MGGKRRNRDRIFERGRGRRAGRARPGRRLAVLVTLAGAAAYLVRRSQRKAELDEGIWHEAPAPAPSAPSAAPTT